VVHVEIVRVLLGTTRGAGYGAPPPTPSMVCHLVACTATATRPEVPQHLFRRDGPLFSVSTHMVVMMVVVVR